MLTFHASLPNSYTSWPESALQNEGSLRAWMPPPINSLHQQVTESFFFIYTSPSFTSRFIRKFCLTLFIPSLLTPLLTESANFIHLKALVLFPSLLFSKCGLLPITLCLIAQAGEGGWSSAGLIKMLMHLKGNISLAERKQTGKKVHY